MSKFDCTSAVPQSTQDVSEILSEKNLLDHNVGSLVEGLERLRERLSYVLASAEPNCIAKSNPCPGLASPMARELSDINDAVGRASSVLSDINNRLRF